MSSYVMPDFIWKNDDINFNFDEYEKSMKLPPFELSNLDTIPYEKIILNQYKPGARMYSFHTSKSRLPLWIKALTLRYWEHLGKNDQFDIGWDEINNEKSREIQITVENSSLTKSNNPKLYLIKVFLKTGTITIQGNGHSIFGEQEFPKLIDFVNKCQKNKDEHVTGETLQEVDSQISETRDLETKPKEIIETHDSETKPKIILESDLEQNTQTETKESPGNIDKEDDTQEDAKVYESNNSTDDLDPLNTTLLDLDPVSLNKVCNNNPIGIPKPTKKTDIKKLNQKIEEQAEINKTLLSTIQKMEGKLCDFTMYKSEQENINKKITSLERQVNQLQEKSENEDKRRTQTQNLEKETREKEETIIALRKQLEQQDKTIKQLSDEKVNMTEQLERNRERYRRDLEEKSEEIKEKSEEIIRKIANIHQLEAILKDIENTNSKKMHNNTENDKDTDNFEPLKYNLETQNRFSSLQDEQTATRREHQEKNNFNEVVDLLIISDSHGNNLKEKKLYRFKKVKIHILPEGKKNISGAKEFITTTTIKSENVLIIIGSNDLSRERATTQTILKDIESLISAFREKFGSSKLHLSPLFHRLNQYQFNNKVDEVNTKLRQLTSKDVYILKNPYLNKLNRYFFSRDGVHFTPLGTSELAKMIKNNINEHLGLQSYSNYEINQGPNIDQHQGYHDPMYGRNMQQRPNNSLSPNERNILLRLLNM